MADPRRVALTHEERFPHGAYAVAVSPIAEYDGERGRTGAQSRDRESGLPLWGVEVFDPDPDARTHQVRVRLASAEEPELPPVVGVPGTGFGLRPVWFGGLVGTPYLDSNGRRPRVAWSLRAQVMTPAPAGGLPAAQSGPRDAAAGSETATATGAGAGASGPRLSSAPGTPPGGSGSRTGAAGGGGR
jgi:hypothetical protein